MSIIKESNYIVIQSFMVNELGLKGNELIIYAIIYGFSQTENQYFTGSLRYLEAWTNSTKQTVLNSLNALVKKGYIEKRSQIINGVKKVDYRYKNLTGVVKKFDRGGKKILPNNKENKKDNNISFNNNAKKRSYDLEEFEQRAEKLPVYKKKG